MESATATRFLGLSPSALHTLRASLERDHGLPTAAYLQEAGFAAGKDTFEAFQEWLQQTQGVSVDEIDAQFLGDVTSAFFAEYGWGTLRLEPLSDAVMVIESTDWAEAKADAHSQYPSCHVSSGLLADFFGRIAGDTVAVMEVECRTRGDASCRFLMGAPDTLATVYERMAEGVSYAEASKTP